MPKARTRKRPCRICRKWFMPDPRQIGRQKTCSDPQCRRESHRRQCARWNQKNRDYFKANYLSEKLSRTKDPPAAPHKNVSVPIPRSRITLYLPKDVVAEVIGAQHLIILEYIIAQVMRHVKMPPPVRAP
jgi:hypothetical protein